MKRNIFPLITMIGMIALSGCEESADPGLSEQKTIQQVLDRIEKNEGISDQIFGILSKRMPSDSLNELKKGAKDKAMFINLVARQTDDYFDEVVEGDISTFDIAKVPTPFSGEAEITLKGLASTQGVNDVIGAYSKQLLATAKEQSAKGRDGWILIEPAAVPGIKAADSEPVESLSLNFTKVEMMATIPHTIIMNLKLTDEEMLNEINDVLNANDIPPVAIGLLLPAVQKVREAATEEQPFDEAMNAWLNGPVTQAIGGGMNRDIIRRIHAAVYLAALHTILLDEYDGTTQDIASLSILHARYRAALIMGTNEVWQN